MPGRTGHRFASRCIARLVALPRVRFASPPRVLLSGRLSGLFSTRVRQPFTGREPDLPSSARRVQRGDQQVGAQQVLEVGGMGVGAVRMVQALGFRPGFTWSQVRGNETGASGRPRGESGATAVDMRSFRR